MKTVRLRHGNPTNDLMFKFVFGKEERKHITLSFINDLMTHYGWPPFAAIEFRNTEMSPEKQLEKLGRLDIFAVMEDGTSV